MSVGLSYILPLANRSKNSIISSQLTKNKPEGFKTLTQIFIKSFSSIVWYLKSYYILQKSSKSMTEFSLEPSTPKLEMILRVISSYLSQLISENFISVPRLTYMLYLAFESNSCNLKISFFADRVIFMS